MTQSLIITKAPRGGAAVVPHQDGCSNLTEPLSGLTFWFALEDAAAENGCLMVKLGSHRTKSIAHRCRVNDRGLPEYTPLDVPLYAEGSAESGGGEAAPDGPDGFKRLEVKAGTLIVMHGSLVHASEANRSSKSRIAYIFGVVDGALPWLVDNYLQAYDGHSEFEKVELKT